MRTLLVEGDKTFKIDIPDDAKVTYGPWSPPRKGERNWDNDKEGKRGTLRVYQADGKSIIGCFAGVTSFREISTIKYAEMVAREEGASIWKDDEKGYQRNDSVAVNRDWVTEPKLLPTETSKKKKK